MAFAALFLLLGLVFAFGLGDGDDDTPPTDITGTDGDDTLTGSDADDLINGLGGDDTLNGGDGNDTLDGGAGINVVDGGAGDDAVILSDGFEDRSRIEDGRLIRDQSALSGGDGIDRLDASAMTESVTVFLEEIGDDLIYGGPQFDQVVQVSGFERFTMGSGSENFNIFDPNRSVDVDLGAGDDLLYAYGNAAHTLQGGAGDDDITLDLSEGGPVQGLIVDGGSGDETRGDHLTLAGFNRDVTATIDDAGTIRIDQAGQISTFLNFERFTSGSGNALIDASSRSAGVEITGGGAADTLLGGPGDDTLVGNDVTGGAGDDLIEGETARGGAGNDTVRGFDAFGGDGDDSVTGTNADGGAGDDTVSGDVMTGGEGTDRFIGGVTVDTPGAPAGTVQQVTDFTPGETIDFVVRYNTLYVDAAPTVTIETDTAANTVTILTDGAPALVVQGTTALPPESVQIRFQPFERLLT